MKLIQKYSSASITNHESCGDSSKVIRRNVSVDNLFPSHFLCHIKGLEVDIFLKTHYCYVFFCRTENVKMTTPNEKYLGRDPFTYSKDRERFQKDLFQFHGNRGYVF